jgi:predicted ATPase/transcriptional regulator with XRE-family HTH domain
MAEAISFGNWIRTRRRALDLTQEALAAGVGCSVSAVRKIEADERRPSRQVAELLADTLQIPPAERSTFLKVARMELGYERLETLAEPAVRTALPQTAPVLSPAIARIALNAASPVSANGSGRAGAAAINLPRPATPLIGREDEVARIAEILLRPDCRLLSLTGLGGIGKTRLAIAAAEALAPHFADGVYFVPLAVATQAESIWPAAAAALGLQSRTTDDPKTRLLGYVQQRQLLLVLDNLEHLLDGVTVVAELLHGGSSLRVLATSREQLGLSGEWVLDVHGLAVPTPLAAQEAELPPDWEDSSAVALFVQAARRADPSFALKPLDFAAVAHICRMVEGIPLGIELSAAWVRMLSCSEIAAEIERSLDFLVTPARDVPQRQQSLRAAFEYSWRLLPEAERRILAALSVFSGGFTRKAAEAVAGASLQTLAALMAKSLALRTDSGRYDLHEVVRQYAAEKLQEAGTAQDVHLRHRQYYLALADAADAARNSPEHLGLVDQLEEEYENLQSALAYLVEHDEAAAWRLVGVLEALWYRRPVNEAVRWLHRMASMSPEVQQQITLEIRARLYFILATFQGDLGARMEMMKKALALASEGNERRILALALAALGNEGIVGRRDGGPGAGSGAGAGASAQVAAEGLQAGADLFAEARRLALETDDKATLATVLAEQGLAERYRGNYAPAIDLYRESAEVARAVGRTDLFVDTLYSLAVMALRQGNPREAMALLEQSLPFWEAVHDRLGLASAKLVMARALTIQGQYERARAELSEGEALLLETGYPGGDHLTAWVRGNVEYALGDVAAARVLYERAIALCTKSFDPTILTSAQRGVALCALRQDDLAAAQEAIEQCRQVCETTNERWIRVLLEFASGQLAWLRGDGEAADAHYRAGLQGILPLGDCWAVAEALEQWALIHLACERTEQAVRLLAAAGALRNQIGAPLPPIDSERVESGIAAAYKALDGRRFAAAWEEGEAQAQAGLEQVVALALKQG